MKKIFKLITFIVVIPIFNGCETEDPKFDEQLIIPKNKRSIDKQENLIGKTLMEAFGYQSIDEMISNGIEPLNFEVIDHETIDSTITDNTPTPPSTLSEELTFEHLKSIGFNEYKLKNRITDAFGTSPDGISINNENKFNGLNPTITYQFNRSAFLRTGTPKVKTLSSTPTELIVAYDYTFYNPSDNTEKARPIHTLSKGTKTTWSITASASLKVGGKIGVPLVTEGSASVTVGIAGTGGETYSNTVIDKIRFDVVIPPHSKRRVVLFEKISTTTVQYTIPVYTSGYLGANFSSKVNGHYYWFMDINSLINSTGSDNEIGTISTNTVYSAEVFALKPIKIGDINDI